METHPLENWRIKHNAKAGKPLRRRDLATKIGCSPARYTQMTRHGQMPSIPLAKRIKAFTGISLDALAKVETSQ